MPEKSPDRWKEVMGLKVSHRVFGDGVIQEVIVKGTNITILVDFGFKQSDAKIRKFAPEGLEKFKDLKLHGNLARKVLQNMPSTPFSSSRIFSRPLLDSSENNHFIDNTQNADYIKKSEQGNKKDEGEPSGPLFSEGSEVYVIDDPKQRGLILKSPFFSDGQWQYEVFFSVLDRRLFRESDLAPYKISFKWIGLSSLLRNLALVKLQQPLSKHLYALYASRTQFEVYQFKPVLKFLANPDQRLLIADEVGLGKTIEAGIIYLELQARIQLNRVLVVCPSGLRYKWQDEMKQRFDEEFTILDVNMIRRFIKQYEQFGEQSIMRGIVSLELLRRRELTEAFDEKRINFDLVIIDEAHHCRNTTTRSNEIATVLSDNSDAMLLLTATPLQIGNQDLFNLLHILNPGEFDDMDVFLDRLEPNRYINKATQVIATGDHKYALKEVRKVEKTIEKNRFNRNPHYSDLIRLLGKDYLKREELVEAQRKMVELNTLSQIFTRTRKREIGEGVPTRAAFVLKVNFTPPEALFYERVVEHARQEFMQLHGTNYAVGWVSIMRERQTASCISAARKRFAELEKETRQDILEEGIYDPNILGELNDDLIEPVMYKRKKSRPLCIQLPTKVDLGRDSKFEVFWGTLSKVLEEDKESKIIVFSFFIATIEHLYQQLKKREVGVLRLHGRFKVPDRQRIIDDFREKSEYRVLISSDVGAEGLDFQFSNTIFNYDLPWNPMRLEQRIGRIDRFGQESERIRIYNLVIQDSIESRILIRLYERIGLFQQAIGDIEAILGEEIRELTRRVYSTKLSPSEEMNLADRAANNIIRRRQEMEEFEKKTIAIHGTGSYLCNTGKPDN